MKLRTTALAVALMASVSCLAGSAQAAPFGGWHGGIGGWHGGGWHGDGWAGVGLGFAAGAIIGGALAAPYYDDYYVAGYDYPEYGYSDAPVVYGYEYAPADAFYGYAVAPAYGYAYRPAYTSYSVAAEPALGYGHRRYERYGYEHRYGYERYGRRGTYATYGTSMRTRFSSSVRGESRAGGIANANRRPLYAHYQGRTDHPATGAGVNRMNTSGHLNAGASEADRGRRH